MIEGRLVKGLGQAADFTQVDWVRSQLIALAGIDPHPGTVNLALGEAKHLKRWREWRQMPGLVMQSTDAAYCSARCYPVRIQGRIPAAVILPDVADYPEDKLEFVAALALRDHLSLAEGARVTVELVRPLPAKAVLFDIDGTLVDSIGAFLEVARCAASLRGLEVNERHVRLSLANGTNFWNGVVPDDWIDAAVIRKEMSAHAAREWPRVLREHGKVFAGLADTLDALKRMGMALGIVSGARPEVLELLREADLLDRFDSIVLAADVTKRKPDPEGMFKCLKALGVKPADAVYVGDAPVDIQAARAAGVGAIGVLTGAADSALLSAQEPDHLVWSHERLLTVIEPA